MALIEANTILYHITPINFMESFQNNGIRLQEGNVNALGQAFYMCQNIQDVFRWAMAADDGEALRNNYCIVFCRVVVDQNIVEIQNNEPPAIGEVGIGQGDVVWRNFDDAGQANNLAMDHVTVIGELQGPNAEARDTFINDEM